MISTTGNASDIIGPPAMKPQSNKIVPPAMMPQSNKIGPQAIMPPERSAFVDSSDDDN